MVKVRPFTQAVTPSHAMGLPCGLRLHAKIPSGSAGVGPWLEPLSWLRPHVLKWKGAAGEYPGKGAQEGSRDHVI